MSLSKVAKVLELWILLFFLAIALDALVYASSTRVFLDPADLTVNAVGDSFTVNVSVNNVTNLYSYDFELYYNSTVINGTQIIQGSFLGSGAFFHVVNFTDHYTPTQGFASVFCALVTNVSGVTGSGVLATIKFKSLALANSTILHLTDVELLDPHLNLIPHGNVDGTIKVISEFTSLAAVLILIAVSLLGVLVGKQARCKIHNFNSRLIRLGELIFNKKFSPARFWFATLRVKALPCVR